MRMWTASANVVGRRSAHERCRWNWIFRFSDRQTKTRSGADPPNVWPIKPKAFATPDLPREQDPVVVFKKLSPYEIQRSRTRERYVKNIEWLDFNGSNWNALSCRTTKKESPTPTGAGLFKGVVFYGGNFTINTSSSSSPTEAQKQQTCKRIKRIFDSSDNNDSSPLT